VDAAHGEALEDHVGDVEADLAGGDPEDRHLAAVVHGVEELVERLLRPGHLEADVETPDHPQLRHHRHRVLGAGVDGAVDCHPIRAASSSRYGFTSVTTTYRAPMWRTMAAAITPIGPAPVMRTSSPTTSKARAVWVALPSGSSTAATSSGMWSGSGYTFWAGS